MTGWPKIQRETFLRQQFAAQSTFYASEYPEATFMLVTIDKECCGRLYVNRGSSAIRILDLTVSPSHRGEGIGTKLLNDLCSEARASGKQLHIHIEHLRARVMEFYQRAGFEVETESEIGNLLVWEAS